MAPDQENFRGIHAVQVLEEAKDLTIEGLIELAHDPYLPAFEKVVPGLIRAFDNNPTKKVQWEEAYDMMKNWDLKTSKTSIAMTLAHFYGMAYYGSGEVPRQGNGISRFEYLGTGLSDGKKIEIFETALNQIQNDFGTWKLPWGDYNRFQRLSGDMDLSYSDDKPSIPIGMTTARWGALAAFGAKSFNGTKRFMAIEEIAL